MKKNQLKQLGLTEELSIKVINLYKEEQGEFIPKDRFDEINHRKKELEEQVTRQKEQIDEMNSRNLIYQRLEIEIRRRLREAEEQRRIEEEYYRDFLLYEVLLKKLTSYKYAEFILENMDKSGLTLAPSGEVLGAEEEIERVCLAYKELFQ